MRRRNHQIGPAVVCAIGLIFFGGVVGCPSPEDPYVIESDDTDVGNGEADVGPGDDTGDVEPEPDVDDNDGPDQPNGDPEVIYDHTPGDPVHCPPGAPSPRGADREGDEESDCPLGFNDEGIARLLVFGTRIDADGAEDHDEFRGYFYDRFNQVEDCLSESRDNILVFPEVATLQAMLLGDRGEQAREAGDTDEMVDELEEAYGDIGDWLDAQYDGLSNERRALLAVTDTVWRATQRTFGRLADNNDAWVVVGGYFPRVEETSDEEIVEVWSEPGSDDESVYIPDGEELYNSAVVFGPDGELHERVDKVILDERDHSFDVSPGSLEELRPVELGEMTAGIVVGDDARTPAFNDRIGMVDAELLLQLQAFDGWAVYEDDDENRWRPDVALQAGYTSVQKYSSYRYGALAAPVGNFGQFGFDGQPAVWGQAHPDTDRRGFVGQCERPGFLDVAPWAFDDPGVEGYADELHERREQLSERAEQLTPGAGSPHEDNYTSPVAGWKLKPRLDYEPESGEERVDELAESMEIEAEIGLDPDPDPPELEYRGTQRPRIAATEGRLALSWQELQLSGLADDPSPVYRTNAVWMDWKGMSEEYDSSGASTGGGSEYDDHHINAGLTTVDADRSLLVDGTIRDLEQTDEDWPETDIDLSYHETTDTGASSFHVPGWSWLLDEIGNTWLPDVGGMDDLVVLAFTEDSSGHDRVGVSAGQPGTSSPIFTDFEPLDEPVDTPATNPRGLQWHPSVDVAGETIAVVWADYRNMQWELYGMYSTDGGDSWSSATPLGMPEDGDLQTEPHVSLVDEQQAVISWTHQIANRPDTEARWRRWDLEDDSLGDVFVLDSMPGRFATHTWMPVVEPVSDDEVAAVWLELRDDTPTVMLDAPGYDETLVVSDPAHPAWWPDMTVDDQTDNGDDRVVVTWIEHRPEEGYTVQMVPLEL